MNSTPDGQPDLRGLFMALLDGTLSPDETDRLSAILREDADARAQYHDLIETHALLYWEHGQPEELQEMEAFDCLLVDREASPVADSASLPLAADKRASRSAAKDKTAGTPVLGLLGDVLQAGSDFLTRSVVLTLLLAIGLPVVVLVVLVADIARQPTPPRPVAVVGRTEGCVWSEAAVAQPMGAGLYAGDRVELNAGLVELNFTQGSSVLLEGPATFRVTGKGQAFLREGSLVANVSKSGIGFTINTPLASIVDLGTEFGVSVEADGTSEAHVFKGEIELAPKTPPGDTAPAKPRAKRFGAGQAVEVVAAGRSRTPRLVAKDFEPGRFVRRLYEDLPRPTIIFSHYGDADPATEGWQLNTAHKSRMNTIVEPVFENGTAAWAFQSRKDGFPVYYQIDDASALTPPLIEEARKKGWVLRARIKIDDKYRCPQELHKRLCLILYRDSETMWKLRPSLDSEGNQCATVYMSNQDNRIFGPFTDSRNQYVDYELRYTPATDQVALYINGRYVAPTGRAKTGAAEGREEEGPSQSIRFGLWRHACEITVAKIEWGILRETGEDAGNVLETDGGE